MWREKPPRDAKLEVTFPDQERSVWTRDERVTVLWCVYHIVEHFGMHTGQVLTMTKAMIGGFRTEEP